jgi:serralysin
MADIVLAFNHNRPPTKNAPTMNLDVTDRRTVLHNFGLAIGLIKEHQNPKANIAWNKELIYREMTKPPSSWSEEMIERNIFGQFKEEDLPGYRDFDPHSIMMGVFKKEWVGGISMGPGENLSESDKALVAKIYPRTN